MSVTVKHTKVSTIADSADTDLVRPSDWNADHALEGIGTMAEQDADNVAITGGTVDDVSGDAPDLSVGHSGTSDSATTADNLSGGEAGQIAVQTGEGTTGFTNSPALDNPVFNATAAPTSPGEGSVRYDETAKALIYYNSTNGNAITIGYNTQARVSNVTANTIYKGMIVYAKASASIGGAVQVEPAIATSYDRSKVFGVATQDILPDEDGFVVTYGLVDGVDTSAWIQGTALYLSKEDEGEFTDEEVFSPNWTIHMGWVTKSLVDGQVFVKGENYSATPERFVGTLEVPNGGSGAVTLSGWLKGNGTAISAGTAGTDYVAPGTATTFTATQTFNGSSSTSALKVLNITETAYINASAPTSTTNLYVNTGAVQYLTSNTSVNWTLNFAFSSGTSLNTAMATGDTISVTLMVTNSTTAYYPTAFTVDGTSVTPKWQGGTAPTSGNASSIDVYNFVLIKTASATYTVLASQAQFK